MCHVTRVASPISYGRQLTTSFYLNVFIWFEQRSLPSGEPLKTVHFTLVASF